MEDAAQKNKTRRSIPYIFVAGIVLLLAIAIVFWVFGVAAPSSIIVVDKAPEEPIDVPTEDVIQHGQSIWTSLRADGVDLAAGPCLDDGEKYEGWAIDLVRGERIDNLPENRCASFDDGTSTRLIELSLSGNVVRILPEDLDFQNTE